MQITAIAILSEFITDDDLPMQDVKKLILQFVEQTEKAHEPLTGEAYPEDRNRYCAVCIGVDGGSARHPCLTVKRVRKFLCAKTK